MGAEDFTTEAHSETAAGAFAIAVERAQYDHGHAGYSGSIAEKHAFILIPYTPEVDGNAERFADHLMDNEDSRIMDKWGPAGCIDTQPGTKGKRRFLFFGWASS